MRVDKAKNIATVLSEVLSNPLQTQQDIANNTGLPKSTVGNAIRELGQIGSNDERLMKLVTGDISIQEKILTEKNRRLDVEMTTIRNNELDQWEQTALKRSQLLSGKATNIVQVDGADILRKIQNGEITKDDAYNALRQSKE